jgi:sugar transferase EpsL
MIARAGDALKRTFDLLLAAAGLVALSPVLATVATLVSWRMGPPVFFRQQRAGRGGRPFRMVKFRTFAELSDDRGRPLPDAQRVTPLGLKLRAWSLDELPELWNVLVGDMSLVGPRPLLVDYLRVYTPRQARRHEVRPGLTGWAQINGRNDTTWDARLEHDVWYVENRSLLLDLRILALTLAKVLRREGVSPEDAVTMPRLDEVQPPQ